MKFVRLIPIVVGIAVGIWRAFVLNENGHSLASVGNCFALIAAGFLLTAVWMARKV